MTNVGEIRDYQFQKCQISNKELNVYIADEFLVYHVLNTLSIEFEQSKISSNVLRWDGI